MGLHHARSGHSQRCRADSSPAICRAWRDEGFAIKFYDTLEDFYLAEALEYITAWRQSTPDNPAGICGPIGPTEQLPLVARLVNELELDLRHCHFWGMDEWAIEGREVAEDFPLSFARADKELCFDRIDRKLRMPEANLHFPSAQPARYTQSYDQVRCVVMQGGQGEVKHWAFNDPPHRSGKYSAEPPSPAEYRRLATRVVDLHPMTIIQNARTSGGGVVSSVPTQAISVGPVETWKAEKVSIWHAGNHDNPFGLRLTTLMISKRIPDSSVPMSLLAEHPNVQFNFYRAGHRQLRCADALSSARRMTSVLYRAAFNFTHPDLFLKREGLRGATEENAADDQSKIKVRLRHCGASGRHRVRHGRHADSAGPRGLRAALHERLQRFLRLDLFERAAHRRIAAEGSDRSRRPDRSPIPPEPRERYRSLLRPADASPSGGDRARRRRRRSC